MTTPSEPRLPAFDPEDVGESNFTGYPQLHRAANQMRYNRRLGEHAGLKNFGVNLTRIIRKRVFYRTGYARGWPRRRVTPGPSSVIGTAWLT
ncbi:hypothetical protein ACVME8_004449 [Bradyrhizobium diazoefficiens]